MQNLIKPRIMKIATVASEFINLTCNFLKPLTDTPIKSNVKLNSSKNIVL